MSWRLHAGHQPPTWLRTSFFWKKTRSAHFPRSVFHFFCALVTKGCTPSPFILLHFPGNYLIFLIFFLFFSLLVFPPARNSLCSLGVHMCPHSRVFLTPLTGESLPPPCFLSPLFTDQRVTRWTGVPHWMNFKY